jgi:hypothetical protein
LFNARETKYCSCSETVVNTEDAAQSSDFLPPVPNLSTVASVCSAAIRITGRTKPSAATSVYADYYPRNRALHAALKDEFDATAKLVSDIRGGIS